MLHTFRADERFRQRLEHSMAEIRQELAARQVATIEAKSLHEGEPQPGGSKLLLKLESEAGERYLFKQSEPALAAAEEAAYCLRSLGERPALPSSATGFELGNRGLVTGVLRPYLEFDNQVQLDADTTTWSEEQRAVMLLEHAWEWFLDNMDTNTSQYGLLGPRRLPVNLDWDRAFASAATSELSRFAKYKPALPNARTFLYADYVAGKVKLPLWLLAAEARRIRRLPKAAVRRVLWRYAVVRFEGRAEQEQFVARVLMRRHGIEREVATFLRSLWGERKALAAPGGGLRERIRLQLLLLWADWQLVLNRVLRGSIGTWGRRLLAAFRTFRAQKRALQNGNAGPG